MINENDNRSTLAGIASFLLLFFLLLASPSQSSVNHLSNVMKSEIVSEYQSGGLSADLVRVINIPAFHNDWITVHDKLSFMCYDRTQKIRVDNNSVSLHLHALQKEEYLTKDIVFYRFYYQLYSLISSDLPGLS